VQIVPVDFSGKCSNSAPCCVALRSHDQILERMDLTGAWQRNANVSRVGQKQG
jgi:hypothetical protein